MQVESEVERKSFRSLNLLNINKSFNGNVVLKNISLTVHSNEVVALLGENGAGKSTLSSIILGIVQPDSGTMEWQGAPYKPLGPKDSAMAGIGLIHQEIKLLPELSIAENLFIGRLPMLRGRVDWKKLRHEALALLNRVGLNESPDQKVGKLTIAAQQQVEIAKALSLNAKILIFDEPTAALGGRETDKLFEQIDRLRESGVGCIYISHRLEEISRIANRVYVLRDGEVVASHNTSQIAISTILQEMVGRNVDRIFPDPVEPKSNVVLKVENLTGKRGVFKNISFEVMQGEIFGIAGIVGAKRTDLVRAIAGVDQYDSGLISLNGIQLKFKTPRDAISVGITMVPEDRKTQGLLLKQTVAENIALGNIDHIAPDGWCKATRFNKIAEQAIKAFGIKGFSTQLAKYLSGGNQQKIVIARWLLRKPTVFILDEPTRGIDMGARAAIYELISNLSKQGLAMIVVSSDLDEVIGLSNRIMVLNNGRQMAILNRDEATSVRIMDYATR